MDADRLLLQPIRILIAKLLPAAKQQEAGCADQKQHQRSGLGDDHQLQAAFLEVGGLAISKISCICRTHVAHIGEVNGSGSYNQVVSGIRDRRIQSEHVTDTETSKGQSPIDGQWGSGIKEELTPGGNVYISGNGAGPAENSVSAHTEGAVCNVSID